MGDKDLILAITLKAIETKTLHLWGVSPTASSENLVETNLKNARLISDFIHELETNLNKK